MKKYILPLLTTILLLSSPLLFALDATVFSISGKAEMLSGDEWVALSEGDVLEKDSYVSTGFRSECRFKIGESYVTLGSLSRMKIEELAEKAESDDVKLYIDTGSLKANIKRTQDRRVTFRVQALVPVASVRGTEFEVTTSGILNVSEGIVRFSPTDDTSDYGIPVEKGKSSTYDYPTATFSRPEDELMKIATYIPDLTQTLSSRESINMTPAIVPSNPMASASSSATSPSSPSDEIDIETSLKF